MNIKQIMTIAKIIGRLEREEDQLNGTGADNNLAEDIIDLKNLIGMKLEENEK